HEDTGGDRQCAMAKHVLGAQVVQRLQFQTRHRSKQLFTRCGSMEEMLNQIRWCNAELSVTEDGSRGSVQAAQTEPIGCPVPVSDPTQRERKGTLHSCRSNLIAEIRCSLVRGHIVIGLPNRPNELALIGEP